MQTVGSQTSYVEAESKLWTSSDALVSVWRGRSVILLAFAINFVLLYPAFFPNLREITGFAEAAYVYNGKKLAEGVFTPFGYSPLSSVLYALSYIPFQDSPYWLIHSCSLGRIALFGLLWLSSYLIATTVSPLVSPLVMILLLAVSPALAQLIEHGSHALFAAMSGFALWQVLSFYRSKRIKHLSIASAFIGLAMLSRSGEGLILFLVLILFSLALDRSSTGRIGRVGLTVLPCAAIVAGYILAYRLVVGGFDLGMAEYSYFTFEQGHGLAHQSQYGEEEEFYVLGQMDARRLFGTPEQNEYSVATAILRNPNAYLERVPRLIGFAPGYTISMYGGSFGLIFFLLAARGVLELIRKKRFLLLVIFTFWCSYIVVYLVLVYQPRHFLLPYYVIFLLATVGLTATVGNSVSNKERYLWTSLLLGLIITAIAVGKATWFVMFSLFLLGIVLAWTIRSQNRDVLSIGLTGVMIASVPLIINGFYPEPKFRELGIAADERAALFMRKHLAPSAPVGAYRPLNVWVADLTYIPMYRSALPELHSEEEFKAWMKSNRLHAIYADRYLKQLEPDIWELVQNQTGKELSVAFVSENGEIQVLLTTNHGSEVDLRDYVDRPWYSSKPRFISADSLDIPAPPLAPIGKGL